MFSRLAAWRYTACCCCSASCVNLVTSPVRRQLSGQLVECGLFTWLFQAIVATSGNVTGPFVSYLAAVCPSTQLRSARFAEDPVLLQEAKAEGLGPRHSLQAAQQVLAEPFLSEFTAEVASAEETGWFWKYQLGLLEVRWPVGTMAAALLIRWGLHAVNAAELADMCIVLLAHADVLQRMLVRLPSHTANKRWQ